MVFNIDGTKMYNRWNENRGFFQNLLPQQNGGVYEFTLSSSTFDVTNIIVTELTKVNLIQGLKMFTSIQY